LIAFDFIAEQRILQAIARGDFDDLPGAGKPLAIDDDPLVPIATRLAHRILKNAGFVPLEILDRREIARLEAVLHTLDAVERERALVKLALLRTRQSGERRRGTGRKRAA
jgi:hypothetical protein